MTSHVIRIITKFTLKILVERLSKIDRKKKRIKTKEIKRTK